MAKKTRRRFTPEEKFNIVKQVLGKARTVSEVSEEYGVHPNQYYRWQAEFFEAALSGFREKSQGRTKAAEDRTLKKMEHELVRMKEVVAEVVSENIELKKKFSL